MKDEALSFLLFIIIAFSFLILSLIFILALINFSIQLYKKNNKKSAFFTLTWCFISVVSIIILFCVTHQYVVKRNELIQIDSKTSIDLDRIVTLVNENKLKFDKDNSAFLPENLKYLSAGTGKIYLNIYKFHKNEMTIILNRKLYFLDVDRYYYSSLGLPTKNESMLVDDTCVYITKTSKPHWYVIHETSYKNASDCGKK